jgi:hypothetical protein
LRAVALTMVWNDRWDMFFAVGESLVDRGSRVFHPGTL